MKQWFSHRSSNPAVQFAKDADAARTATQAELRRQLAISTGQLHAIAEQLAVEMAKGACRSGSTVAMLPSYVTGRVTGRETGTYYALDLGGTNLRVCEVKLNGDGTVALQQQKFAVPPRAATAPRADDLFDFVAECVGVFLRRRRTTAGMTEDAVLGFTFSFPFLSTSIDAG
ncbi:MAG: hypothetical protein BJ554DRAFT_1287, partial [Olpidium bornovanus]